MVIVDRFEGEYAVCELSDKEKGTTRILIEKTKLPCDVKEGDILAVEGNSYVVLKEETKKRRNKIIGLSDSLFE